MLQQLLGISSKTGVLVCLFAYLLALLLFFKNGRQRREKVFFFFSYFFFFISFFSAAVQTKHKDILWEKVKAFFFKPDIIELLHAIAVCRFLQEERFSLSVSVLQGKVLSTLHLMLGGIAPSSSCSK